MELLVAAIVRWPRQSARNYVSALTLKNRLDILQIILIGGPVFLGVMLTLGRRLLGAIGLPGPLAGFAICLAVGIVLALVIGQRAKRLAAPAFLATQPIPDAVARAVRRRLAASVLLLCLLLACLVGLVLWRFASMTQSGTHFVLPFGLGLAFGALVSEVPPGILPRLALGGNADAKGADTPRTLFARWYRRRGPLALWWRFQGRGRGSFIALKIGLGMLAVVILMVIAFAQQVPWAWPALMWLVGSVVLVEELNLSGFASRVLLVQPGSFWSALRAAALRPLLAATAAFATLGGLGFAIGALTLPVLLASLGAFLAIGLLYLFALAFARGDRRAALLIAGACLSLTLSNSDYLREGTPLILIAIAVALLMAARRSYLWPSRRA
jgi:hypothetical protein